MFEPVLYTFGDTLEKNRQWRRQMNRVKRLLKLGELEVDLELRELRKAGRSIKLQKQPFQILETLLERGGDIVTREELQKRLWPRGTHVDFDRCLGTAIGKLRTALNDSGRRPRFIETVNGRGFRLLVPAEPVSSRPTYLPSWKRLSAVGVLSVLLAGTIWFIIRADHTESSPSVAVLPLDNISLDPALNHVADGMTEALIHTLAQIPSLGVISRTSVMQYKEKRKPLHVIAEDLGVTAVLEGSVQRFDNRLKITVQLIDGESDRHLWSGSYESHMDDVLALQDDVARAVARKMEQAMSRLFGHEKARGSQS
jgi:TolB-like protein/DNA-binding winged helix-turn-helix (wHTH) protein